MHSRDEFAGLEVEYGVGELGLDHEVRRLGGAGRVALLLPLIGRRVNPEVARVAADDEALLGSVLAEEPPGHEEAVAVEDLGPVAALRPPPLLRLEERHRSSAAHRGSERARERESERA
jgi:hypothetical protein